MSNFKFLYYRIYFTEKQCKKNTYKGLYTSREIIYENLICYNFQQQPSGSVPGKRYPKICCKFTREHPYRGLISIMLLCKFIEMALQHGSSSVNLLQIFRTSFPENTSGRLLLNLTANGNYSDVKGQWLSFRFEAVSTFLR